MKETLLKPWNALAQIFRPQDNSYQEWTGTEIKLLKALVEDNKTDAFIASVLNRTEGAVYQRRMKLNRSK